MSDDLVEFGWFVAENGYEWVVTRFRFQPYAPTEPLSDDASEDERARRRRQEFDASPRPYLVDRGSAGGGESHRPPYFPLNDLRGWLHRIFAKTEPTQEGMQTFANQFGLLGGDIAKSVELDMNAATTIMVHGEWEGHWRREILDLSDAVELWDNAMNENNEALSKHIIWRDNDVLAQWPRRRYTVVAGTEIRARRFKELTRGDLVTPAVLCVQQMVNDRLGKLGRVTPRLLWNSETGKLEQHLVPNGLIGAIWLDFLFAIDGYVDYRRCLLCGTAFPVAAKGQARKFCSNKCRVANHRRKKEKS